MNPRTIIIGTFVAVILMAGHSKNFRKIAKGRKIAKKTKNMKYMPNQESFERLSFLQKEHGRMIRK